MPIIKQKSRFEFSREIDDFLPGYEAHQAGRYNLEISARNYRSVETFNSQLRKNPKLRSPWKAYPLAARVTLPRDEKKQLLLHQASFGQTLTSRRAVRFYSGDATELADISELLLAAWGDGRTGNKFCAPSGGARLPIELYLCLLNVKGAKPGYYHYNHKEHELELIEDLQSTSEMHASMSEIGIADPNIEFHKSSFVIILTAVFQRNLKKYGHRGWRFISYDAGHLGQNLWLTGTSLKLGVCGFGAGFDSRIAKKLRINPASELPMVAYVFGVPRESSGIK